MKFSIWSCVFRMSQVESDKQWLSPNIMPKLKAKWLPSSYMPLKQSLILAFTATKILTAACLSAGTISLNWQTYLPVTANRPFLLTQPVKLSWMAASELILDATIQFKLGCRATKWIADGFKLSGPPGCLATEFELVDNLLGGTAPKFKSDGCIQY
jgi:hypothetical protein